MAGKRKRALARSLKQYRWGATKAQGAKNQRERDLLNRISDLETALLGSSSVIERVAEQRDELRKKLDAIASPTAIKALDAICMLPTREIVDLGIYDSVLELCRWVSGLEGAVVQNVAVSLEDAEVASGNGAGGAQQATGPVPAFPSAVSGITKVISDHDDETSIDDLFARAVDVHLERMDHGYYWLGLTPIGGQTVHIDITKQVVGKRGFIRARIRQ